MVTESNSPYGFSLEAGGDFVGYGVWTLTQDGEQAVVVYDWRIRAEKPLLKLFTPLLRPLFAWNHRWAMAEGERCLKAESDRRFVRQHASVV